MKYLIFALLVGVVIPLYFQDKTTIDLTTSVNQPPSITLIDTLSGTLELQKVTSFEKGYYVPLYMGKLKDTIALNYHIARADYELPEWKGSHPEPGSEDLKLIVDTQHIIGRAGWFFPPPPPPVGYKFKPIRQIANSPFRKASFLVFIENTSSDTVFARYGWHLPMFLEAQDSCNVWRPIQKIYRYGCGMGWKAYSLPPNYITLTSCPIFEGNFRTKMRLVFGFEEQVRSNEFEGWMNYGQFRNRGY